MFSQAEYGDFPLNPVGCVLIEIEGLDTWFFKILVIDVEQAFNN